MSIIFSWAVKSTTIDKKKKRKKMKKKNRCVITTVHQSSDTMYLMYSNDENVVFYSYIADNGLNVN